MARSATEKAADTLPSAAASNSTNKGNDNSSPAGTATDTTAAPGAQGPEPVVRVEVIRQRRLGRSGKLGGETYLYDTEIQLDTARYRAHLVPSDALLDAAKFR